MIQAFDDLSVYIVQINRHNVLENTLQKKEFYESREKIVKITNVEYVDPINPNQ